MATKKHRLMADITNRERGKSGKSRESGKTRRTEKTTRHCRVLGKSLLKAGDCRRSAGALPDEGNGLPFEGAQAAVGGIGTL